ncbi:hypothetical protein MUK42_08581 [Musa troglodytarum]|uniref:Uncharacterized protein n=1 Tax=Musa troglodytarum TaxID=320322 RepID=A0A9E7EAR8_9LILI|nr:hypothetical protein MUK42_08581 [Musa troglodytarum]
MSVNYFEIPMETWTKPSADLISLTSVSSRLSWRWGTRRGRIPPAFLCITTVTSSSPPPLPSQCRQRPEGMCLLDIAGREGIMQYGCVGWKRTGSLRRQAVEENCSSRETCDKLTAIC